MAGDHHGGNHSTRSKGLGYHIRKNSSITSVWEGKERGNEREKEFNIPFIWLQFGLLTAFKKTNH